MPAQHESQSVNLDEVVEQVIFVPIWEQNNEGRWARRVAIIRDYVPMATLNRYLINLEQLRALDAPEQMRWMVQQVALVWRTSEPLITPYALARGLTFDQIVALLEAFFNRPEPEASRQSLERLNFGTSRSSEQEIIPPEAMSDLPLVTTEWDAGARQELLRKAAEVEDQYPEDAAFFRAQAAASLAQARANGAEVEAIPVQVGYKAYDAMRLYADMGSTYPWMTDAVIDAMHYPKFFGYVREASLKQRRIDAQTRNALANRQIVPATANTEEVEARLGRAPRIVN